jgi:hypothetical protein
VQDQAGAGGTATVVAQNVPFDRYQLSDMVDEVGGYLTELRHIDLVFAYFAGYFEGPHGETPDPASSEGYGNSYHTLDIPLGRTFPFQCSLPVYNVYATDIYREVDQLAGDADHWATDRMASFLEVIRPIAHPTVREHDLLIDRLTEARSRLPIIEDDFADLGNNLGRWSGQAAENFADHFYEPFGDARDNQATKLTELIGALAVSKAIINFSQQSVMNAVSSTRVTLREQLQQRSQGIESPSLKRFLSVASHLTGALGLVLSGYPLLGVSLDVVSLGLGIAEDLLPERSAVLEIEGQLAATVAHSTSVALSSIKEYVDYSYGELDRELRLVRTHLGDLRDGGVLLPGRPAVADGVSGDDFHHVTSSRFTG